jgi:hypothetical protein
MDMLPHQPAGNWMTPYFYIIEEAGTYGRDLGDVIAELKRTGHKAPEIEYARDMASVHLKKRTFEVVAHRRELAAEQAA